MLRTGAAFSGRARGGIERKGHDDLQAAIHLIADFAFAAGAPREPLDDGEPQPAMPAAAACRIEPHEGAARLDEILRRNALAMIGNRKRPAAGTAPRFDD